MDKNTKWLAAVYQDYVAERAGRGSNGLPNNCVGRRSTQIIQLNLRAESAKVAMDIAAKWLEKSGIKDAYISEVCRDGLDEVDVVSTSDSV